MLRLRLRCQGFAAGLANSAAAARLTDVSGDVQAVAPGDVPGAHVGRDSGGVLNTIPGEMV